MIHLSVATPERFSRLALDPAADLERLRRNLTRGTVRREHLLVATEGGVDVARVGIFTHADGTSVAYAFRVDPGRSDVEQLYTVLLGGVAEAAGSTRLTAVHASVVDADELAHQAMRAALASTGWEPESDRLELSAQAVAHPRPDDIVELDPSHPDVVTVMAAAMADSLDDYDRDQVAARGPEAAAAAYRDMMAQDSSVPWLAHRGPDRIDGLAAIMVFPGDWSLGYLGVDPRARRRGVGAALASAMLSATAASGVVTATASVAVTNLPIRATLERVGFAVRTPRTDFVFRVDD